MAVQVIILRQILRGDTSELRRLVIELRRLLHDALVLGLESINAARETVN
jgi:hypothetical protein